MAMPMAHGISATAPLLSAFPTLLDALPGPMKWPTTTSASRASTISAPAYTSHFSCSRSTVPARRYRNTTETMAATPVPTISSRPPMARTKKTFPAGEAAPMGFGVDVSSVMSRGAKALPRTQAARPAAAAQATGRQRGEGR